jgi:hypothetical protein
VRAVALLQLAIQSRALPKETSVFVTVRVQYRKLIFFINGYRISSQFALRTVTMLQSAMQSRPLSIRISVVESLHIQ